MRRAVLIGVLVCALATSIGACRTYPTRPVNRRPTISSVVAFPTLLGQGDSTLITVVASDPDDDPLVYDWEAYNGLRIKGDPYPDGILYNTPEPSRVLYLSWVPDSCCRPFIWCSVRDSKGGCDSWKVVLEVRR